MNQAPDWTPPLIEGSLVRLRPYDAEADFAPLWELLQDPEGKDLTATVEDFNEAQVRAWLAKITAQGERLDLVIEERATGAYAGEAVLNEYEPEAATANFRIALRGPAFYGRGLGSEATALITEYALGPLGLRSLTLTVLARNPRALRAYERAGFVETGREHEDGEEWVTMRKERHAP